MKNKLITVITLIFLSIIIVLSSSFSFVRADGLAVDYNHSFYASDYNLENPLYSPSFNAPVVRTTFTFSRYNSTQFLFSTQTFRFSSSQNATNFINTNNNSNRFYNTELVACDYESVIIMADFEILFTQSGTDVIVKTLISNFSIYEGGGRPTNIINLVTTDNGFYFDKKCVIREINDIQWRNAVSTFDLTLTFSNSLNNPTAYYYIFSTKNYPNSSNVYNNYSRIISAWVWLEHFTISQSLIYDVTSNYYTKNASCIVYNFNSCNSSNASYSFYNTMRDRVQLIDNNNNIFNTEYYHNTIADKINSTSSYNSVNAADVFNFDGSSAFKFNGCISESSGWLFNVHTINSGYFESNFQFGFIFNITDNLTTSIIPSDFNSDFSKDLYKQNVEWYDIFSHLYNFFIYLVFDMPIISNVLTPIYSMVNGVNEFLVLFVSNLSLFGIAGVVAIIALLFSLILRFL